jgi:hypothetical protein
VGASIEGYRADLDRQCPATPAVGSAAQQAFPLGQVLLAVRSGPLVRRAQQLDDRDQLPAVAIPDLQERPPLDVFVDRDVLVELDDVVGPDLGHQALRDRGQELLVEVVPGVVLLQVGVHARERGWHRRGLRSWS